MYSRVFSENTSIDVWPKIAIVLKKTDEVLEKLRPKNGEITDRFLKKWRHIICFFTVSRLLGSFDFSDRDFICFDTDTFTEDQIRNSWEFIFNFLDKDLNKGKWTKKGQVIALCMLAEKHLGITRSQRIEKNTDFGVMNIKLSSISSVSLDFALKVKELLPVQPWKPGQHKIISKSLNCTDNEYFSAVELLIDEGLVNRQKDGVVYDSDGNVLCFDPERVDPQSMMLFDKYYD
ncbi:hypothetical protein RO575_17435 [Methylomonas sp. MO1]|uniref:hypothetical protein n=1 Tax=Methylomonas sp. MO1 TaxID=3073619 RepID=UPI0028A428BC|nr:hypothetical protein [Methylomonas sp. MO1]MDT4291351.1 hypothetical protein [Methylomonas sp. MO1]